MDQLATCYNSCLFVVSKQANITEKFIDAANHQDTTKTNTFNESIKLMRMNYS